MAIIQPDGLFNGKRLRACSDQARLLWPYLFLASNGFGRLEIDHESIFRNYFVDFRKFPKVSEFFGILREYQDNGLLFLYEVDRRVWGQWDCKPGSLPRFKTTKDLQSPEPPPKEYENWKKTYLLKTKALPNISEIFGNLPKISVGVERCGVGVGVERCGVGKHSTLASAETAPQAASVSGFTGKSRRRNELSQGQQSWFNGWWDIVWARTSRGDAERAWGKAVRDLETFTAVMEATRIQAPLIRQRSPQYWPHPATWLNGKRWLDDIEPLAIAQQRGPVDLKAEETA